MGDPASERKAFFASLPDGEFTALEANLRKALLEMLGSRPAPFTFPLVEWIDRRLGGEVATSRDENGLGQIQLQGNGVTPEEFFIGLPQDSFLPEEEAMREAILDFFASLKTPRPPTIEELSADPGVAEKASFLPAEVQLSEWIARRIGEEVVPKEERGETRVHLSSPEVRQAVQLRAAALGSSTHSTHAKAGAKGSPSAGPGQGGAAGGKGPGGPAAGGSRPQPPESPPKVGKGFSKGGGKGPGKKAVDAEEWLASLPQDQLTGEEAELRQAILDWIREWPRKRPNTGVPGLALHLSDAMADQAISRCRLALLPEGVKLQQWIDSRIGGEVEVRTERNQQAELRLRGAPEPVAAPAAEQAGARSSGPKGAGRPPQQPNSHHTPVRNEGPTTKVAEDFIRSLPGDALTEAELELRQAILELLSNHEASGEAPPTLAGALKDDDRVKQARIALLPPQVPLRLWVDQRIGGEVEVFKNGTDLCLRKRDAGAEEDGEGMDSREEGTRKQGHPRMEDFLAGLPDDRFTLEETQLREALLRFLDNWSASTPPTLPQASADINVKRTKKALFDRPNLSLKDWIERRIGGELEVHMDAHGQYVLARKGADDGSGGAGRKRAREDAAPADYKGGKGRPSYSNGKDGKGTGKAPAGAAPWKKARADDAPSSGGKGARWW